MSAAQAEVRALERRRRDAHDLDAVPRFLLGRVLVTAQDAREHADLVLVGERLAELGQQMRRRLDAGPVVLVEDEQARLSSVRHAAERYRPPLWRAHACASSSQRLPGGRRSRSAGRSPSLRALSAAARRATATRSRSSRRGSSTSIGGRARTRAPKLIEGVRVHYLATPFSYRWMGITPTLPRRARTAGAARRRPRVRLPRPGHDRRRRAGRASAGSRTCSSRWGCSGPTPQGRG